MPLVSSLELIKKAKEKKAAIAAFNIHNLETIQAVIEGASEERAPVIIQTTPGTLKHAGIEYIGVIVKKAAEMYDIPVALHVDHCPSFNTIVECIRNNYTSVMIDGANLEYDENVKLVKRVTEMTHAVGMQVEGEIGRIGGVEDDMFVNSDEAALTIPSEAKKFVEDTGIDTLAIAIGTAHGMYKGEPKLDFERLSAIEAIVDVPLVLHGASGVPDESIREAIRRGIAKINIATELKNPMAKAIVDTFDKNKDENDPRNYMGAAREAVKEVVKAKIRLCGSNGLADEF
ncbi:fructose-bisphosphate aldolase [Vallitalea longa]|uniref:Fructose-bisphosphate aldolase n=1 Tax=Vallitalea longa TaxID=2936439 RepID=A0A9W5YAU4_9FIRM|nr:class II fructose-bisphosphate aldolase [Vallitalea longa]GKX27898.1 fructose-bisphosphate aldolase [Vallitalea longa]